MRLIVHSMNRIINNSNKKGFRKELRKNQTPQEIILWSKIRNNQTGFKWRRQVSIGSYIADFYCQEKLLVIEIDGSQHEDAKLYDKQREKFFQNLGIKTLRFWNNEINTNIKSVMLKIYSELSNTLPHPNPLLARRGSYSKLNTLK